MCMLFAKYCQYQQNNYISERTLSTPASYLKLKSLTVIEMLGTERNVSYSACYHWQTQFVTLIIPYNHIGDVIMYYWYYIGEVNIYNIIIHLKNSR